MSTQVKDITRFNRVYDENKDEVFRTALCYAKNNTYIAEEITQNVFLKLYNYSDTYDENYLPLWLLSVTKNEAINYMTKNSREVPSEKVGVIIDLNIWEECVEEKLVEAYDKETRDKIGREVLEELYELNPRWYEVITLVYCLGMKQADVAEKMGISLMVLHGVLYRARKWTRKRLKEKLKLSEYGDTE